MCFLSLGSIKRRASLLASDADGFGTTGFAGDLRSAGKEKAEGGLRPSNAQKLKTASVKTNSQPISYCPPLAAVMANGRLSSIVNSVPAGSIADLLFPSQ